MLYIVGTPIGNLSDITLRAIKILEEVDFIAAEDTRVTLKLLNHLNIQKPMVSYHDHNIRQKGIEIITRIKNGENCAIVTDAGMPCISDPGEDLVKLCYENDVKIEVIPGPSAVVSALAISGQDTKRFTFEGFLSTAKNKRFAHLKSLNNEKRTMIFYEAPHKLLSTLIDMFDTFGNRDITVVKEMTKIYEKAMKTDLETAVNYFTQNKPKGEYVLVLAGKEEELESNYTINQAVEIAKKLIEKGNKPTISAKLAAEQTGYKKSEIYTMLIDKENL